MQLNYNKKQILEFEVLRTVFVSYERSVSFSVLGEKTESKQLLKLINLP